MLLEIPQAQFGTYPYFMASATITALFLVGLFFFLLDRHDCSGESYQQYKDTDPMITEEYMHAVRNAYAPNENWQDPFLSPVMAILKAFPLFSFKWAAMKCCFRILPPYTTI